MPDEWIPDGKLEEHQPEPGPRLARWFAWTEGENLGDAVEAGLVPDAPIDELAGWLREGGELPELSALRLLDELAEERRERWRPLDEGVEAAGRLRSAINAAALAPYSPSTLPELSALLRPLEAEISALGALRSAIRVERDAAALLISVPAGAPQLTHEEIRAIRKILELSGARHGFEVIVFPPGSRLELKGPGEIPDRPPAAEAAPAEGVVQLEPAEGRVRFEEPLPPPVGFQESAGEEE